MSVSDSPKPSKSSDVSGEGSSDPTSKASGEGLDTAVAGPSSVGSAIPKSTAKNANPFGGKGVEMGADEQKKLEDIRKKLKDIFVTAEKAPAAPKVEETVKAGDAQTASSGLLDLRDLAKSRKAQTEAEPRVDDDMLLLSGGLFGGGRENTSLAPPDLSMKAAPAPKPPPPTRASKPAPVVEDDVAEVDVDVAPDSHADEALLAPASKPQLAPVARISAMPIAPLPAASSDDMLIPTRTPMSPKTITAIALALAAVLGGVFFVAMRGGEEAPEASATPRTGSEVSGPSAPAGDVPQGAAPTTPGAAQDSPQIAVIAPGEKSPSAGATSAKGDAAQGSSKTPGKPAGEKDPSAGGATTAAKPDPGPAASPTPTQTAAAPPPVETAKPAPPPPPAADEFDRSAASAALNAAAARAMGCKGDGPAGSTSVSVTFAPSGRVTSARVEGGTFAGTPTGGCIATAFRSASVPPFGGSPVTVTKKVSIR